LAINETVLFLANYVAPATILVIMALGLDLQWGHTGLFNAGVAAFVGVGSYTFGMMSTGLRPYDPTYGYPGHWGPGTPQDLIVSALVAMIVAGGLGILIAIPTIRLRADYLAIATLALAEIIRLIFKNAVHFTGGDFALDLVPRPFASFIPGGYASDGVFAFLVVVILLLLVLAIAYLGRAPWGRNLKAVREDEEATEALGKDTFRLKLGAFGLGCAIMGLAGSLQASWLTVVLPDSFLPFVTFTAYVVVMLGGSGHPKGVVLGGYLFYAFGWIVQQIKSLPNFPSSLGPRVDFLNLAIIGLVLILLVEFRPSGILPERKYIPRARS
jgi:branched-chain amino acid transport system permease protein